MTPESYTINTVDADDMVTLEAKDNNSYIYPKNSTPAELVLKRGTT